MSVNLKITLAQTSPSADKGTNLKTAEHVLSKTSKEGTDLVVFPETFMAFPGPGQKPAEFAESPDGPFVCRLAVLAKKYTTGIICGVWETIPGMHGKPANKTIVFDNNGKRLTHYSKLHLYDALGIRESDLMTAGNVMPTLFTINDVSLGMAICYDLRFPELFRNLAMQGAEVVIIPAAWYAGPLKEEQWLTLLRARAIENTVYTVGVNYCTTPFAARSAAFDPFGAWITDLGEKENLRTVTIDKKRLQEIRSKMPTLTHVRSDVLASIPRRQTEQKNN